MISTIYILAKNEAPNIERCLDALVPLGVPVVVLDSGSDDGTQALARNFVGVEVQDWIYENHCSSYNRLTLSHSKDELVFILDADMRFGLPLLQEVQSAMMDESVKAAVAKVQMYWVGHPLKHAHLYPPKPIAFRGAQAYFEPVGHGERLIQATATIHLEEKLVHDDRKSLETELVKQCRYAEKMVGNSESGALTWRDRIRVNSPMMIVITPIYAFLLKNGFRNGKVGLVYCLDRLIAEALMYRAALMKRIASQTPSRSMSQESEEDD